MFRSVFILISDTNWTHTLHVYQHFRLHLWVCAVWVVCVSMCMCVSATAVYHRVAGCQLCLGAGGLQRDQDQRGEVETYRLHSSSGTAHGSALLSRELSAMLINLSEKSFILGFLVKIQKRLHPFYLAEMWEWTRMCNLTTSPRCNYISEPRWCTETRLQATIQIVWVYQTFLSASGGIEQSEPETCLVDISKKSYHNMKYKKSKRIIVTHVLRRECACVSDCRCVCVHGMFQTGLRFGWQRCCNIHNSLGKCNEVKCHNISHRSASLQFWQPDSSPRRHTV